MWLSSRPSLVYEQLCTSRHARHRPDGRGDNLQAGNGEAARRRRRSGAYWLQSSGIEEAAEGK